MIYFNVSSDITIDFDFCGAIPLKYYTAQYFLPSDIIQIRKWHKLQGLL